MRNLTMGILFLCVTIMLTIIPDITFGSVSFERGYWNGDSVDYVSDFVLVLS